MKYMKSNKHEFLYVVWRDPRSRRNYVIGKLARGNKYTFNYCADYKNAQEVGWELLDAFPEEKEYESDVLFAAFAGRLPDPKRRGIESILQKYGLSEFDGYELLKKSTGRLPFDTYEFIDPILPEDEDVQREFYLMGVRHYLGCNGTDCSVKVGLRVGDELVLVMEPDNVSDPNAVKVESSDHLMYGYIPRYYSEGVTSRISKGMTYSCVVIEIDDSSDCENCIKVRLKMPKDNVVF